MWQRLYSELIKIFINNCLFFVTQVFCNLKHLKKSLIGLVATILYKLKDV